MLISGHERLPVEADPERKAEEDLEQTRVLVSLIFFLIHDVELII